VLSDAAAAAARRVHLEVRAGNPGAALYRQAGFAKVGERRGYYRGRGGQLHDAHTYALPLA
jgi:[ribosomal protein S18]-alanine N-acetyltransferase